MRAALIAAAVAAAVAAQPSAPVIARRLPQNPLVTQGSSSSLGDNINGPAVIRVPAWVEQPLGRYYMYFAHHMGTHIRLAYADAIDGPWRIHEAGVMNVRDTAFFRPQPDPPENLADFYTHVASPDIEIDHERRRFTMWFHGWWTEGKMWPVGAPAARKWATANGYSQFTQAATSSDGLRFEAQAPITRWSYLRVFRVNGALHAVGRLGRLLRAKDANSAFEPGPNPFRGGRYDGRVRHVALLHRGDRLYIFFTAIGDAPERIMVSTMPLAGDWSTWTAAPAVEVLRPEAAYECPTQTEAPSLPGDVTGPVKQLRDPAIFEEGGRAYLFYSYCGEQGIAAAELTIP